MSRDLGAEAEVEGRYVGASTILLRLMFWRKFLTGTLASKEYLVVRVDAFLTIGSRLKKNGFDYCERQEMVEKINSLSKRTV